MTVFETASGRYPPEYTTHSPAAPKLPGVGGEAGVATPLGDLCDHILTAGHDRLKARLPRLRLTLLKVADAHASRHPELHRVLAAFARFADDLARHLSEEDHVLFPMVGRLEGGGGPAGRRAGATRGAGGGPRAGGDGPRRVAVPDRRVRGAGGRV